MAKKKIKSLDDRISKNFQQCSKCFTPQFLKFNFTFLNLKCLSEELRDKASVLDRIIYVSNFTYNQLMNMEKGQGFELVPKKDIENFAKIPYEKNCDTKFEEGHRYLSDKCHILRVKNRTTHRFIGEVIKNIYYVYCIDFTGKAYDHGS